MDKDKLIIVCDGTVTAMSKEMSLTLTAIRHGECLIFDSMEQFADHINGRLVTALEDTSDATDRLNAAFKELELSAKHEHDFTVSYKEYLSRRKNKRAMYKRR